MSTFGGRNRPDGIGCAMSLIDAVYRWCQCVNGDEVVSTALRSIGAGLGAEALAVSRARPGPGGSVRVLAYDGLSQSSSLPRLTRSFATSILGDFMPSARPGSVWLRSAVEVVADPALELFHSRRTLRELAIVPLATDQKSLDFLEMHFPEPLVPGQHAVLNALAQTLSEAWRNRSEGIFVSGVLDSDERDPKTAWADDLLGHHNPASFSRAEYRVCLLLSRGAQLTAVCDELSIAQSTLRTHLRNIYSKTATENLPELLYLLLRTPGAPASEPISKTA
ncbi:helix-turn-helix transcriptional regulator [Tropicimonas marinistellae]|uniref:helix-turn-helix transcriptional regulator n=1 Tax=Tropicimonas marinistellae TaxID=1739787 RepID=UPI00122E84D2|nr:hypothetical protein [Tropicimonas marinistellae]